jgi:formyl-CoA transferase/CoA:oxalate CoA-transferase
MLDGVVSLLTYHASMFLTTGTVSRRLGNRHATIAPYETFSAADGEMFLAVGNDDQFRRFCEAAGFQALMSDTRFSTNPDRVVNHDHLRRLLAPRLSERPRAFWIDVLTAAGVPCGAVRTVPEALADPQLTARQMIEAVEHATAGMMRVLGVPIRLSETPGSVRSAPPVLGQHTLQVLSELGLTSGEIDGLRRSKAI